MGTGAPPVARVDVTPEAAAVIRQLVAEHGPLLFHQSGGCCDDSAPMCYPRGEFRIGQRDVLLGEVEGCPVYIGGQQFEYWQHTHLTLDVVKGRGAAGVGEGRCYAASSSTSSASRTPGRAASSSNSADWSMETRRPETRSISSSMR